MKKFFYFIAAALVMTSLSACDDDDDNNTSVNTDEEDSAYEAIVEVFVNDVVIPTYHNLSDYTDELTENLTTFKENPSQANLQAACESFLTARAYWEKSEAFLFGPATVFGIDPHIDSWPLDVDALDRLLATTSIVESLDGDGGDVYAGEQLGNALLGFHGIEYILFEDGAAKTYTDITNTEMIYCVAVAGDLRNKCWQMEIAWAGTDGTDGSRFDYVVDELEANVTLSGSYYGEGMLNSGKAGGFYSSWSVAMQAIVDGMIDIADEVATQKIGKPYNGTTEEDIAYIESPYSWKSILDFYNNMVSIKNVYYGGLDAESLGTASANYSSTASIYSYMSSYDSALNQRVVNAIEEALDKVGDMAYPFVNNRTDASVGEAQDAVADLSDVLSSLKAAFTE